MSSLSELVSRYVVEDAGAAELHREVQRHVEQVSRRYPDAYFELGRRTSESVEGLADRVFTICARVPKGRFPFRGRAPFPAFVEERFDDPPIRYHSFYPGHSGSRYQPLMSDKDVEMLEWVRAFNRYDLYTKHDAPPDVAELRPYYEELISRYFPSEIAW